MSKSEKITSPEASLLIKVGLAIREAHQLHGSEDVVMTNTEDSDMEKVDDEIIYLGGTRDSTLERVDLRLVTFLFRKRRYFILCARSEYTGNVYVNLDTLRSEAVGQG